MSVHEATAQELDSYREHGYFMRPAQLAEQELEPLRSAVEEVHARIVHEAAREDAPAVERIDGKRYQKLLGSSVKWEWQETFQEIRSMEPYHHLDPRLDALLDDPRLWGPTRRVVDSDSVSLFSDKLNFKRPKGAPFPWHQDTPYWAFGCQHLDRLVSVLVYLDDATRENGCLWVIPGSHRHGVLPVFEDQGVLGRLYTDLRRADVGTPVALEAPAGSVLFFHGDLVHGSRSNRSPVSRRALVLTYQPGDLPRWQHEDVRAVTASPA
ncbi:MAG: phytanoyl-CoA dioxygenase family protein [Myxococcota bacterium]